MRHIAGIIIRRELRSEKGLFILATLTMAIATAMLALVLLLADTFEQTRLNQARTLLGGDLSLRLSQRNFSAAETDWLTANSTQTTELRIARVLAIAGNRTQLVRLKGVEANYPLFGELHLQNNPDTPPTSLLTPAADDGIIPTIVDKSLSTLLGVSLSDTFIVSGLTLRVVGVISHEPDPDPRMWVGAPVVFVNKAVMLDKQFMRPGTLVSRFFRVVLNEQETAENWRQSLAAAFPDAGWRVRGPGEAQSTARRIVNQIRDFLALAALAAMLVAGIGCGNAISAFLRARIRTIAVIKMIGGNSALVRRVYLTLPALITGIGTLTGALVGAMALFFIAPLLSPYLPWTISPIWSEEVVLRTVFTAILITAAFAIPPVLRFVRTNPLTLFATGGSDNTVPAPDTIDRLTMIAAFALAAVALPLAWNKKVLLIGVVGVAGLLYLAAIGVARLAELTRRRGTMGWRLGMLAIARNRYQTATGVMSFGIGVFVLTAVLNTETNFSNRIDDTLRKTAPALYFVGTLPNQADSLGDIITAHSGTIRSIPFLRGRINAIGGRTAEDIAKTAPDDKQWILRGDRGLTWSDGEYIGASHVTAGELWDTNIDGLQASFDGEAAADFGVSLNDMLELNVLGQKVTAVVSSFREIDWQSFDINFVVILSAPPFANVPHTFMGAAYLPADKADTAQLAIGKTYPNITPIATAPIFDAAKNLLVRAAALLQATALFLLATGLPMIIATLIENRRRRLQNATVLRLLGATRRVIITSGITEFLVMAILAVVPAILLGVTAGYVIVTQIFQLSWQAHWDNVLLIALLSGATFLALGAADIARAAKNAPYPMLRNE